MSAADLLKQKNGLKTTQSVLQKQQSGQDAAQKQMPVFTQSQLDAAGKKIDAQNAAVPKDETPSMNEARVRTIANQKGVENGINMNGGVDKNEEDKEDRSSIPIVKKEIDGDDIIKKLRSFGTPPFAPISKDSELGQGTNASSRPKTYADIFKMLNPEPKELSDKEKKRMRTKLRIAAVADGLRALSDIYFASKGTPVEHDPEKDLTRTMLKRKQMMDEQYKNNRDAWLKGYQRALEKDNDAKFKQDTLNEQKRYHDIIANNNKEKNDLSQQKIKQGDKKIQLAGDNLNEKTRHNKEMEGVARQNADTQSKRANTTGKGRTSSSSSRKGSYSGNVEEYITLKQNDPQGMAEAEREASKLGYSPKTPSGKAAVRIIYKKKHGGGAAKGGSKGGTTTGGKKKTGVNWK